jgi:hypothetical protein
MAEDVLQADFPRTYSCLKSCQSYLASRKLKDGQPWYAFRNENVSQFIESPKIVASVVNSGGGFALDQHQHLFCKNSVILICPYGKVVNSYFLLAILNSKVFRTWAQHRMPTVGSGWYSCRVGVLRKFPVPIGQDARDGRPFKEIADLAVRRLNETPDGADRDSVLFLIDDKVCEIYGLSQSELDKCPLPVGF